MGAKERKDWKEKNSCRQLWTISSIFLAFLDN